MRETSIGRAATILCALLVALTVFVMPFWASSEGDEKEALTVGVPVDRCPIFYKDPNTGEPTGIGVELMRFAAEDAGYSAIFRFTEEETLKEALDNAQYDVIMPLGSAITSASGHSTIVTENLFHTPFTFVTKGNRALPPLDRLRVGMLRTLGGGIETLHQLYPDMEILEYENMPQSVKALRAGEVDALLHNSYVWSYVLQKPSYSDLTVQPSTVFSMDFRAGTLDTPRGEAVIERLNRGIALLTDTRRQAVILDYTSRRLYRYDVFDFLHQHGQAFLLVLLLFAALAVIAAQRIQAFRRQQDDKIRLMLDHDSLTGLLSMNGFRKRVEEVLRAHPDAPYFLSYNNVRDFKFINDSLGRAAGDDLLRFWARKSMENLSDDEAIGRVAADHFAVLRHISDDEQTKLDERNVFEPVHNFFIDQGKDLNRWNAQGYHRSVSVNVSRDDINESRDISSQFSRLIQTYDLTPDQLRIEITETAYVENHDILIEATQKLRDLGFQVEMDDFGSGYSSLHMLKEVPVDRIKLDLHFLTSSGDPEKSRTIVRCMINMVRLLGMQMIAEGVETVEQAEFLDSQGCSEMQGHYFYKPMPVEDFEVIMQKGYGI